MSDMDERYLIERLKEDDIHALKVIFDRHYSNLYQYLLLIFKNQLLVENIAQDIFVYLWENRKSLEIRSSLASYLFAAGRYKAINKLRDAKRHEIIGQKISESQDEMEKSPVTLLETKELEQIVEEAIGSLPERCQQIFRLSREEDLSYKEIASLLNISVNTVENQMSIALKKLRERLRPYYIQIFFFG
jgi:RNA polymerase sigma-70 factor, ECF subfamily